MFISCYRNVLNPSQTTYILKYNEFSLIVFDNVYNSLSIYHDMYAEIYTPYTVTVRAATEIRIGEVSSITIFTLEGGKAVSIMSFTSKHNDIKASKYVSHIILY